MGTDHYLTAEKKTNHLRHLSYQTSERDCAAYYHLFPIAATYFCATERVKGYMMSDARKNVVRGSNTVRNATKYGGNERHQTRMLSSIEFHTTTPPRSIKQYLFLFPFRSLVTAAYKRADSCPRGCICNLIVLYHEGCNFESNE